MNLLRLTLFVAGIAMLTAFKPLHAAPDGHLIIIGGGLRGDNVEIGNRIVELAGGKGAKIAVIPAAASNPEMSAQAAVALLDKYGADAFVVPVSVHLKDKDYVAEASRISNVAMVSAAGGVYFVGGNQNLITKVLRTPEGVNTPLLDAIWAVYRKGGVIAGTSAGAAIMSESMFGNPPTVMNSMQLDVEDKQEIVPGLGFVGPELFIDQHAIIRGRFARMIPLMIKKHYEVGLGIAENTAMVIDKNHNVEIIGYTGAIFIDLKDVRVNNQISEFNASNIKISYLDRGERFNYLTRTLSHPIDKLFDQIDRSRPFYHEKLFSADILGNAAIVELMQTLIDSDQSQAIGLAVSDPDGPEPEKGFRFRLTKTDDSTGYRSDALHSYSVLNLRLDIQPIEITQPFFILK